VGWGGGAPQEILESLQRRRRREGARCRSVRGDCVSFTLGFLAQARNGNVVCETYMNGSRIDALHRIDTPLVLPNAEGCSRASIF